MSENITMPDEAKKIIGDEASKTASEVAKQEVSKLESLITKSVEAQTQLSQAMIEKMKKDEELAQKQAEKQMSKKSFDKNFSEYSENNLSTKTIEESQQLVDNPNRIITVKSLGSFNEIANQSSLKTKSTYNTFDDVNGGLSMNRPTFMGRFNANKIAYAPIVALSRQVVCNLNGDEWVGFDPSVISYSETQELTPSQQSALIKEAKVELKTEELSTWVPISNRIYDATRQNAVRYDIVAEHQNQLSNQFLKKANDKTLKYLKEQMLGITENSKKIITSATSDLLIDDLIDFTYQLKDEYLANAVFFTKRKTSANLSKQKATSGDGQYMWRGLLSSPAFNMVELTTPAGSVKIVGISDFASETFSDLGAGNLIGVFADFNEFLITATPEYRYMDLMKDDQIAGYVKLYERTYFGQTLLNKEAGKPVFCKAS